MKGKKAAMDGQRRPIVWKSDYEQLFEFSVRCGRNGRWLNFTF